MKLKSLRLANYRGFEQIDLDFSPDVTVLAGVNGMGKSGILKALANSLSLALPEITPSNESHISFSAADIKLDKTSMSLSAALEIQSADILVDVSRASTLTSGETAALVSRRNALRFEIRETDKGSNEEREIQDEIRRIDLRLKAEGDNTTVRIVPKGSEDSSDITAHAKRRTAQPLAILYTPARFLSRLPPVLPKKKSIHVATAYNKALSQLEVSLNDFANWFRTVQKSSQQKMASKMLGQLEKAISTFLSGVTDLELHDEKPPRFSVMKNGSRLYLEQLSDGERGLLALVFDLVRRLAIANPESDDPIAEGVALVMIDEIEMHLHPKWQRHVVRRLRDVFESCQFVITTHSPQVIGQVRGENLRLLTIDDSQKVVLTPISQAYGMDSSWVLQNIMGVPARDYETENALSQIYDAIDEDQLEKARELAETMKAEIGNFPDLEEATALLDRFELLGRE